MSQGRNRVLRHLRRLVQQASDASRTDRELLQQFVALKDERAFEAIVRRHARLVMSVCRRVLVNEQDAEDAFQAVFLVLAKKAATVAWRDSISTWLYQVASRVALKARGRRSRRQAQQQAGPEPTAESTAESLLEMTLGELRLALDEELHLLPERYRAPLQLCYLQGRTQDEAARELGWTEGALRGRLIRGRELLRKRLARRGISISAVLLAAGLAQMPAEGAVAGPVIGATVQAAVHFASGQPVAGLVSSTTWVLTQGVLQAMFLTKVKMAAVLVLGIGLIGLGAGLWLQPALANPQTVAGFSVIADEQPAGADAAQLRPEDQGRFKKAAGLRGTIHAVDASKTPISVTINVGDDDPVRVSLDLASDAKVLVAGKPAAPGDLRAGTEAVLVLAADNRTVNRIEARGRIVEGTLVRVDTNAGTLTVKEDDDDDNATETTVTIAKDTPIWIDDYLGRLVDLADCKEVELELAADEKSVGRIFARWAQDGDPQGRIIQIDAAKGEVTVRVEDDDAANNFTLKVTPQTKIYVNGQPAKLADLQPGWQATLRGDANNTVTAMRVVRRAVDPDDDD